MFSFGSEPIFDHHDVAIRDDVVDGIGGNAVLCLSFILDGTIPFGLFFMNGEGVSGVLDVADLIATSVKVENFFPA